MTIINKLRVKKIEKEIEKLEKEKLTAKDDLFGKDFIEFQIRQRMNKINDLNKRA